MRPSDRFQAILAMFVVMIVASLSIQAVRGQVKQTQGMNAVPQAMIVNVTNPTGGTVSGVVQLRAVTDKTAQSLTFNFRSGTASQASISAGSRDGLEWTGNSTWDTSQFPDATSFTISARAVDAAGAISSGSVTVTIENQAQQQPAPILAVSSPPEGATLSGQVGLTATTSGPLQLLRFLVTDTSTGRTALINGIDQDVSTWVSSTNLNTATFVNGTVLSIKARTEWNQQIIDSPAVTVTVNNIVQYTVNVTTPTDGTTIGQGSVRLTAVTSTAVDSLEFILTDPANVEAVPVRIPGSNPSGDKKAWVAAWTNDRPANSRISIIARALLDQTPTDSGPVTVESAPVQYTVNVTTPTDGTTIGQGSVRLTAVTSTAVDSLEFILTDPANVEAVPVRIPGSNPSGDKKAWVAAWTNDRPANSRISIIARALLDQTPTDSGPVTVESAPVQYTVNVTAPSNGTTIGQGTVQLAASTSVAVDDLKFVLSDPANAAAGPVIIAGRNPSGDKKAWVAAWTNDRPADSNISIIARALLGQEITTSIPVSVTVQAPDYSVIVIAPRDNSAVPPGSLTLSATTSVVTDSLEFVLTSRSNNITTPPPMAASSRDGKSWTAVWNTEYPDDTVFSIAARSSLAEKTKESLPNTFMFRKTAEMPLSVVVSMPTTKAQLSQVASFSATTSRKADGLKFRIDGPNLGDRGLIIGAQSDPSGITWSASLDTLSMSNGDYRLKAVTVAGAVTAESPIVDFSIFNDQGQQPPETGLTVTIEAPAAGSSLASRVLLGAITSQRVDSLTYFIDPLPLRDGATVIVRSGPLDGGTKWTADWDSTRVTDGNYRLVAKVIMGGRWAGESSPVDVIVANKVPQPPLPGTEPPKVEPLPGTEPPVVQPALLIKIVPVPGPVRGNVLLSAAANGRIPGLNFQIGPQDRATRPFSRPAVFSRESGLWQMLWDTTVWPDGKHEIVAVSLLSDGTVIRSEPFWAEVINSGKPPTERSPVLVILPPDVVKESTFNLPPGTKPLVVEKLPEDLLAKSETLDPECAGAGIPPERCQSWLARRNRTEECRKIGILTKEECLSFMKVRQSGNISECAGKSDEACSQAMVRKTVGMMTTDQLDRLSQTVTPLIGQAVRFARPPVQDVKPGTEQAEASMAPTERPEQPRDKVLAEFVPLRADKEIGFRVQASPGYVQATEEMSFRAVPAVLLIDSDGDGLPDDVEKRLGSDPGKIDTDGDSYSDFDEVKNGYSPLGPGRMTEAGVGLTPVDTAIISGAPLEQPRSAGETDEVLRVDRAVASGTEAGGGLRLDGKAAPGQTVTIFIYSYLPVVLTTTADADGNWTYNLDADMADGEHEAYVVVTEDTGKIKTKSAPLSFFVAEAEAVTEENFYQPTAVATVLAEAPVNRMVYWYAGGAILLVVVALLVGAMLFFRPRKERRDDGNLFSS